ncbi:hypothetical protein [Planctobacterium marinum]|uniref:hypothetical protein n=1 Tax=Planctobacterium marinum TaxID=1631968 RepID=UPI001E376AC9|nr:hypothetical protein [Planctobacterium marinum]MCC2607728.1 hypothetical protein [Planctobacterium marinum]
MESLSQFFSTIVSKLGSFIEEGEHPKLKKFFLGVGVLGAFLSLTAFAIWAFNNKVSAFPELDKAIGPKGAEMEQRQKRIVSAISPITDKIIPAWKSYTGNKKNNSELSDVEIKLKKDVKASVTEMTGIGFNDLPPKWYVFYLFHYGYLHKIYGDLYDNNSSFYIASYYLELARLKIEAHKCDKEFSVFIKEGDYEKDIYWLITNTDAFIISRILDKSEDLKTKLNERIIKRVNEIGGCKRLSLVPLHHEELRNILCPSLEN